MEYLYEVSVVPLIVAMVGVLKTIIPEKYHTYMGLVAWGIGLALALAYGYQEGWEILKSLILGSLVGLSAAGFYSTQKNAREGLSQDGK